MEIEKAKEEFRNELIRFKKLVGDLDEKIFRFEKKLCQIERSILGYDLSSDNDGRER